VVSALSVQADLQGKVAIVTGASAGIGFATARILAERGVRVLMTGTRVAALEQSAVQIRQQGGEVLALAMNLTDEHSIKLVVNAAMARYGRIDILHNNAADLSVTTRDLDVESMEIEVWERIFDANVRGTMLCSKHVLPHMVRQGAGSIINTSSALALNAAPVQAAYSASKAAIIQMSRSIATSHGKRGIRCNAVLPGLVLTEAAMANLPPPLFAIQEAENLTPYLGRPEDIAYVVAFLASDESRYVTGQAWLVDGGSNAHIAGFAQQNALPPPG
jgi:NAD(P)-dependent dehydrogenase (short-subunit alcohol dehydrogenase family)